MKVNWAYLKKPSVIIGAVVLFFVLLFLMNRSGGASSAQTVVNSGPSDAQVAAQTQLALAQVSAGVQGTAIQFDYAKSQDANATTLAIAQIQAALTEQNTAAQRDIAEQTVNAQVHGLDLQYQTAVSNNAAQIAAMTVQANYGIESSAINANLQAVLSQNQLEAYKSAEIANVTESLGTGKYADRRLGGLTAYLNSQGGSLTPTSTQLIINPQNYALPQAGGLS